MRRLTPLVLFATVLSTTLLAGACDEEDPLTPAGGVTISLAQAGATVFPGASASLPVTVSRSGDFTGAVTLTAENLPAGVTVSFEPATVTGTTSILTVTGASGAATGTGTITVRGAGSGTNTATASLPVTIAANGVTFRAVPTAVSTPQGVAVTVPLVVERIGTFTGDVAVETPGLPTGVSAAFSPTSVPGGTRLTSLTLTPASTVAVGSLPIVVTGTASGIGTQVQTVMLTVTSATVSGFTMSATPAALAVQAGLIVDGLVTVSRQGTFTGAIQLTASGAPNGMTVSLTPTPSITGSTATLTITTDASTTPGVYPLTVTGTASGATHATAYVTVVVTAPPS